MPFPQGAEDAPFEFRVFEIFDEAGQRVGGFFTGEMMSRVRSSGRSWKRPEKKLLQQRTWQAPTLTLKK